jgi:hypothetical protein
MAVQDTFEIITGGLLGEAFNNWVRASDPEASYPGIVRSFKEVVHNSNFLSHEYRVPREIAVAVRGMAGPYGHAYCKMIMAQRKSS